VGQGCWVGGGGGEVGGGGGLRIYGIGRGPFQVLEVTIDENLRPTMVQLQEPRLLLGKAL